MKNNMASMIALFVAISMVIIHPVSVVMASSDDSCIEEEFCKSSASSSVRSDPEVGYGCVEETRKVSNANEISFEDVCEEEEMPLCATEEGVLGESEMRFNPQPTFNCKDGYRMSEYVVVDSEHYLSSVGIIYIVKNISTEKWILLDITDKNMVESCLTEWTEKTKNGVTRYIPITRGGFAYDDPSTEQNEHYLPLIVDDSYNNMSREWMDAADIPIARYNGMIGYMTTYGGDFHEDNGQAQYEEELANWEAYLEEQGKSSSSSSGKDSSSSSGKDSSSSSGKDSSSSSSKDSSSSSEKDSSSSSGKDSSSSSEKDSSSSSGKDSSSSSKDDSSSSTKDDSSSSDATVTTKTVKAGAASYEVKSTKQVDYDGRKHVAVGMKETAKQIPDIKVEITRDGKTLEPGTYKLKFKNNSAANGKTPSYKITLGKGYDKAEKKAISKMTFAFDIAPLQVEAKNFTAKKPATVKDGKIKVKLLYKLPNGKLLTLKKGTYTLSLNGENVTITCKGNLEGTVTIPLKQLQ